MDDAFRLPNAKLAKMIAIWPPYRGADLDRIADEIPPAPVSHAVMWLSQCRSILPPDQLILSDYLVLSMLERAATETTRVGIDGIRYMFTDGSTIVANSGGDRAYKP